MTSGQLGWGQQQRDMNWLSRFGTYRLPSTTCSQRTGISGNILKYMNDFDDLCVCVCVKPKPKVRPKVRLQEIKIS